MPEGSVLPISEIDRVFRAEYGRAVAILVRVFRDDAAWATVVGVARDTRLQDLEHAPTVTTEATPIIIPIKVRKARNLWAKID